MGALAGGLETALLLARGRPDGLARLVAPPADPAVVAGRSFWAMLFCLPPFLLLDAWGAGGSQASVLVIDAAGWTIGWVGYAVLSHELARRTGRAALWPRFIAAWNWSNVAQYALQFAAGLAPILGAPDWATEAAWLVALGWSAWIEWYATRLTLEVPGIAAAGLVALSTSVGLLAAALASSFAEGSLMG